MLRRSILPAIVAAGVVFAVAEQSHAAMITASQVINNWAAAGSPVNGGTSGNWYQSGATIQGTGNHVGSLASDFTASGNSTFSVDTVARDNDTFGLLWGFQDLSNHYRFSWAQDYGESGVGAPPSEGFGGIYDGFKIIKESGGSSSLLYSSNTEYVIGHNYNLSVTGTGTGFNVLVQNLTTSTTIFNVSVSDTTFTSGKVGIHELFQGNSNVWSNFDYAAGAPVPEPTSVVLWGLAAVGLVVTRRRMKRQPA
jgi:hypothetical protein